MDNNLFSGDSFKQCCFYGDSKFFSGDRHGDKMFGDKNIKVEMSGDSVRGHTFESGDSLGDRVLSPKVRGQLRGQKICSQMVCI